MEEPAPAKPRRIDPATWVLLAIVAVFAFQALLGRGGLESGKPAPAVRVPLLAGGSVLLGDSAEVQLLDFWATWCGPCVVSMPTVARVARDYAPRGLSLYAVNTDQGDGREDRVRDFLKQHRLDVQVALDGGEAFEKYQVEVMPTLYVVKRGTIQQVHVGVAGEEDLRRAVEAALGD